MGRNLPTGGPKGGDFYKDPYGKSKSFSESLHKESKQGSRFFRNFYRTKTKAYMTTYNDIHYLSIYKIYLNILAGDPETSFDALIDIGWEMGAKTGNIKDLDATQETAIKEWVKYWIVMAWELAAQNGIRPFVPAFTESSITATSATALSIWTQADWDAFIASVEKLDCPDFVYRFMKPFLFIIKMSEGYERAGLPIPPSYFVPITHLRTLAQMQGYRELAKTYSANAMVHCKKFGIPFSKFSLDKLKMEEVPLNNVFDSNDRIAFFAFAPLKYYDNNPAIKTIVGVDGCYAGGDLTSEWTPQKYPFIDGQPMSVLHAFAPLFAGGYTYNANNNPYTNIIALVDPDTNEYEVNIFHTSLLGTTWTAGTYNSLGSNHVLRLFRAHFNGVATTGMAWTGTKVTADQTFDVEDWTPHLNSINVVQGTGVNGAECLDALHNAFKYFLYGD